MGVSKFHIEPDETDMAWKGQRENAMLTNLYEAIKRFTAKKWTPAPPDVVDIGLGLTREKDYGEYS